MTAASESSKVGGLLVEGLLQCLIDNSKDCSTQSTSKISGKKRKRAETLTLSDRLDALQHRHKKQTLSDFVVNDVYSCSESDQEHYLCEIFSDINRWTKRQWWSVIEDHFFRDLRYLFDCFNNEDGSMSKHERMFIEGQSTSYLRFHQGFWEARRSTICRDGSSLSLSSSLTPLWFRKSNNNIHNSQCKGIINETLLCCLHSTCHFVQSEGGTGVAIIAKDKEEEMSASMILTAAHVICSITDSNTADTTIVSSESSDMSNRCLGRKKWVMFGNGLLCRVRCIHIDHSVDLALLEIEQNTLIFGINHCSQSSDHCVIQSGVPIADRSPESRRVSELRKTKTTKKYKSSHSSSEECSVFCVGNPSNMDLECESQEATTDFDPRCWHLSFGNLIDPCDSESSSSRTDGCTGHSCWTYWGHSGAPIFDDQGKLVAVHVSWDPQTGLRYAVNLAQITQFLRFHKQMSMQRKRN